MSNETETIYYFTVVYLPLVTLVGRRVPHRLLKVALANILVKMLRKSRGSESVACVNFYSTQAMRIQRQR